MSNCQESLSLLPIGKCASPTHRRPVVAPVLTDWFATLRAGHVKQTGIMILAKTLGLSRFITFRTFRLRPPTLPTKTQSILGFIELPASRFAAFLTRINAFLVLIPPFGIVMNTKASPKMRVIAERAFCSGAMNKIVLGFTGTQLKVLYAIIVSHFVLMVNLFFLGKKATDKCLHNQAVLTNIPTLTAIRMIWELYLYIPIVIFELFSVLSVWMSLHGEVFKSKNVRTATIFHQ